MVFRSNEACTAKSDTRGSCPPKSVTVIQAAIFCARGPAPRTNLSSSPPSLRTMFRSEKTVPNISFASSSALRAWRAGTVVLSGSFACDVGREVFPEDEVGLGSQRRLYIHSAADGQCLMVRNGWKTCHDDQRCRMSRQPSLRVTKVILPPEFRKLDGLQTKCLP